MEWAKKLTVFCFIFSLFIFSSPSFSSAHAYIVKSTPSENQILAKPPKKVTIEFDESIQTVFHSLRVFDLNGKQVDAGNSKINSKNPSEIECDLKPNLPDGTYRIDWKVVSSDGHPVEGVIPFGIGEAGANQTNVQSKSNGYFPHADLVLLRGIQFISGSLLVGLIFFYLFVIKNLVSLNQPMENRYKKAIIYSYWLLLASVIVNLPLQATIEARVNWSKALNIPLLKEMLMNSLYGKVWMLQTFVLIILFFTITKALRKNSSNSHLWQISFILCCCFLLAKSFTSHALSTNYQSVSIIMDFFHLLGASIWTGSLMGMIVLLPLRKAEDTKIQYRQMIKGFFNWGVLLVLVLTITGLYSSFMYVTTLDSLVTTNYGRILLAKVLLFFIMLLFAFMNFLKGKTGKEKRWGFSLLGEMTTGFIILVLAVILTNLPTSAAAPSPFNQTIQLNKNEQVTLKIDPKIIGFNHYEVIIKEKSGNNSGNIQQVTITLTPPDKNLVEETFNVPQVAVGRFYTQGMDINAAGKWKIHLHVLNRDLESSDVESSFTVGNR